MKINKPLFFLFLFFTFYQTLAQHSSTHWANDGKSYFELKNGALVKTNLVTKDYEVVITADKLKYNGNSLDIDNFKLSSDEKKNGSICQYQPCMAI
jgi:hypothetical protein